MPRNEIDIATLRRFLAYDATTGVVTWIAPRTSYSSVKPGERAGMLHKRGYRFIKWGGVRIPEHRIAWALHHGAWPEHDIDHIDMRKDNNRIDNLRDVPSAINRQNVRKANARSQCGTLGVYIDKSRGVFVAELEVGGKRVHRSRHPTPEAAHAAYVAAKRLHHPGCTL